MSRDGPIFGDLIGKLDMVRVEWPKCGRSGVYRLADLIMRYGRDAKIFAFTDDVTATCERRRAHSDGDPCGAISRRCCKQHGEKMPTFISAISAPQIRKLTRKWYRRYRARFER